MPKVTVIPCDIKTPPQFTKMRVAAYCRVSTDSLEQSDSLEAQVDHYTEMIEKNPFWNNAGIFAEYATGLNTRDRPDFLAMMRKCRKRTVDAWKESCRENPATNVQYNWFIHKNLN